MLFGPGPLTGPRLANKNTCTMIRKRFPILPLVAALFLAVSCDPTEQNPVVTDTLTVSPASLDFEAEDASVKLAYVTTEKDWTATPSDSWIHLEKTCSTHQ